MTHPLSGQKIFQTVESIQSCLFKLSAHLYFVTFRSVESSIMQFKPLNVCIFFIKYILFSVSQVFIRTGVTKVSNSTLCTYTKWPVLKNNFVIKIEIMFIIIIQCSNVPTILSSSIYPCRLDSLFFTIIILILLFTFVFIASASEIDGEA